MTPRKRLRSPRYGAVALLLTVCAAQIAPRASCGQTVWELTPYRMRLVVYVAPLPGAERWTGQIERYALDRAAAVVGAAWHIETARVEPALLAALRRWPDAPPIDALPLVEPQDADQAETTQELDKLMLLVVTRRNGVLHAGAREFDVRTRRWSSLVERAAAQSALLPEIAFHTIVAAFKPLARVESSESKAATLRVRGAALPPRDSALQLISASDVLQPVLRFNERDGTPKRIVPLPWTFLTIDSIDGALLMCSVHSGIRNPLGTRTRGRLERLALVVRPPHSSSQVRLVTGGEQSRPLEGYAIYAHPPTGRATELIGHTDVDGTLVVPPADHTLRVLVVKHGDKFLARLPIVPGLEADLEAEVIDDDERLRVAGVITGMQENLVDLVVRRQMLMIRLRAAIENAEFERAQELVRDLRAVRSAEEQFGFALREQRQSTVSDNPYVQRQIDKLLGDTEKLMAHYFDPRPIRDLEAALARAQSATTSRADSPESPSTADAEG